MDCGGGHGGEFGFEFVCVFTPRWWAVDADKMDVVWWCGVEDMDGFGGVAGH